MRLARQIHAPPSYGSRNTMNRYEHQLRAAGADFARLMERIPLQDTPPLAPDWLRCEMLERYQVLQRACVSPGSTVLEVGSGPHAIATVPLAFELGPRGLVIAAERARWGQFREVARASGLEERIRPITCDARHLPLPGDSVDLAVCVHGIRSLASEASRVEVFREMLRVARQVFVAESLPIAMTDAQRAHLAMYELREGVFEATTGRRDDLRYPSLELLRHLVEQAGGGVTDSGTLNVNLPHALAYFPRSLIEAVPNKSLRDRLLVRWDDANAQRMRVGADHPPVGIIRAYRS